MIRHYLGVVMGRFLFLICSPFLIIILWALFNKIGWIYAVIWVMAVLIWAIFSAKREEQKANAAAEAKRYEEQAQRPKPENYDPFFPNRPKDDSLKGKITYTNKNGDDFTINLEIKIK